MSLSIITRTPKKIIIEGDSTERHDERVSTGAISPGHIITRNSSNLVLKHATAGAAPLAGAEVWVAKEDHLGVRGGTINDAYSSGDRVFYHDPRKGDLLFCRVAAMATAIALNDPLTSDGAGCLKLATSTDTVLARAEVALDNSTVNAEAFIKARWTSAGG